MEEESPGVMPGGRTVDRVAVGKADCIPDGRAEELRVDDCRPDGMASAGGEMYSRNLGSSSIGLGEGFKDSVLALAELMLREHGATGWKVEGGWWRFGVAGCIPDCRAEECSRAGWECRAARAKWGSARSICCVMRGARPP